MILLLVVNVTMLTNCAHNSAKIAKKSPFPWNQNWGTNRLSNQKELERKVRDKQLI